MNNKPVQILLADDDTDDRFLFREALSEIPVATRLTTVHDGEELMDYLSKNVETLPNILFLDLNMPRKNGFECLSEIKHHSKFRSIPVIMFSTSYSRDMNYEKDMMNMLYKIGADDYIRKPDDFKKLKEVIQEALASAQKKNKVDSDENS